MQRSHIALTTLASACLALSAAAGPEWVEKNDAGESPRNAQNTNGDFKQIDGIRGTLGTFFEGGNDQVDMYYIRITDPDNFTLSTNEEFNRGESNFDTRLWLFEIGTFGRGGPLAFGLLANDDVRGFEDGSSFLRPVSDDDSGARVREGGLYLIAISNGDNMPFSEGGDMFFFANPFEVSGPDGQGGNAPFLGWRGEGEGQEGIREYRIGITGATFANLPAPGAFVTLVAAGLIARGRRRN
ncbi:MAG: hypothetical protein ACR2GY_11315 [Phycisphaerales bacterium]